MEIWKDYPLNSNYLVSNLGRIKSKYYDKILTPKKNWDGYHRIQIWDRGSCNMIGWHRVIAQTFVPNPEDKPFVNHKDGNKINNIADNLEWVTQQENIIHSWENGFSSGVPVQMIKDGVVIKEFDTIKEASEYVGCKPCNISHSRDRYGKLGKPTTAWGYVWKSKEEKNKM